MKPLSKKTRFKLIIVSLFVFLILAPMILANSFGYKISSLEDVLTLVRTGGIYLNSDITNTSIYVDDEYYKESGRLLRNTLIQNLPPNKTYKIVIQKEGLHDWRKKLVVYPSLVTEASVLMLPIEIEKTQIFPYLDEDGNGTTTAPVISVTGKKPMPEEEYVFADLMFFSENELPKIDLDKLPDVIKKLEESTGEKISTSTKETKETKEEKPEYFEALGIESLDDLEGLVEEGDQIAWLEDGNVIVGWTAPDKLPLYYYCSGDAENHECREKVIIDWEDQIKYFDFMPGRNDVLIVLTYSGIYAVEIDDRSDRNIQPVYLGEGLEFRISQDDKVIVKEDDFFYELDF
jgi:hypothetical protein